MSGDYYKKIFARNLKRLMNLNEKTQSDLVDDLKVTKSAVSTWCNGTRLPRMDKVNSIAEYFGVNRSDLIEEKSESNQNFSVRINVLGSVPAGIPIEAIEDIVDLEDIPKEWTDGGKEFFGLRVSGDSMSPKYISGDTIIVRKCEDCESGDDCVVYVNGYDATLKKVIKKKDCTILQPLNPTYEPKIYNYSGKGSPVKIAGVVVEIRRKV